MFKEKNSMKAKMKKSISISTPVVVLALLVILGTALAAGRDPVSMSGEVDLNTFSGTATITIGGEELEVTVQVIPKQPPVPKDGGLYFPEVEHVFTLEDESILLITTGEELAMPTDENSAIYTLHGNMVIIDGTGVFDGASGELRVNGQMDWSIGQATFDANGAISR